MTDHNNTHIHLIITGGTIDSVFDPSSDSILVNDASVVKDHIDGLIRPHFKLTQKIVTLKDSRELTDHTREDIISAIQSSPSDSVVLTHGTFTMATTATYLQAHAARIANKTVVLTGSFFPIKGFSPTDASFNLGFACAAALLSPAGVYLAMNGKLFSPDRVAKNISEGRFESI